MESAIKLAGQRSHFQTIFDHLPDAVLVLNPKYVVEEANLNFLKRFGKKAADVVGRPCYEVFHGFDEPCDRQGLPCPMGEVLQSGRQVQVIQQYPDRNGERRYEEITMSPLCPPEGDQKEIHRGHQGRHPPPAIGRSPADFRGKDPATAQADSKSKVFLETIVDGIEDHMMVIDLDYRIVEVNRALLQMVGLSREEVVGKHCYEVSHHLEKPCSIPITPVP